jgi:hypothetical protein
METIEERRAKIKADRAALVAKVAERDATQDPEAELRREELALANETAIFEAEAKHGRIRDGKLGAIDVPYFGVAIFKQPQPHFYKAFMTGKSANDDAEKLVKHALVYPSLPTFDGWLEAQPALLEVAASTVVHLAGRRSKEVEGK